jgi:nitrate reductase molybdenum cofactor assembly chaperone NarJ/NarW
MSELDRIAELLRYPDPPPRPGRADTAEVCEFFDEIARVEQTGLEELYTRTFDLNPVATLEVGWHLWGEQYERGRFLADLTEQQHALEVEGGSELPDHLTVLLPMLARMRHPEALAAKILPAIEKILAPLVEHGNPYRHLLAAARAAVAHHSSLLTHRSAGGRA